jgi:molecular chaperone DnaK (HSP70)
MVQNAEQFADEDKKRRELVDAKNQADSVVYQTEKQLSEFDDKLPQEIKDKVNAKLTEVKDSIPSDDAEKINAAVESLQKEVMEMGQAVYSQAGAAPGAEGAAPGGDAGAAGGDDDVIDAEFSDSDK